MFGDVTDPTVRVGSQKWYTVPLSILAHVSIFAAVTHDDGVRRGAAAPTSATTAAAGPGRGT
jgi:hypothetical protein